jgi:hypothetical protein
MSDTPTITQQYSFAVGEDGEADGIEPTEESVETSLETWGADVDHRERDTRMAKPEATSFGVDDRKTVTRNGGGEQHALFADTEDDQRTLGGERAASQCLFESDEQDDTPDADDHDDEHAEEPDTASDEPIDTTTEASPRAVATDGGQPVEDETNDHGFAVGTHVEDRDADNPNPAVVVVRPDEPAYAREIPALDETVADVNPDYPASGPVTTVAYADDLDDALDVWREADPDALAQICDEEEVRTYDFPTARLRKTTMSDGGRPGDNEADQPDEQDHNRDDEADFDPHQHVPDEIDTITADGIEQVHEHLSNDNADEYAEASVEEQAAFLWEMVDRDVIDLNIN